ncbi:MAG: geranylgeranyl reductase family protein [Desulfatibacillaceae bacterium]|nr:geranylgeranyl reductase family protein [Desulfatibacillaceae bacterium]
MQKADILIIGAGPAGASAASFAAKAGLSVILADKAVFPRDKICGDGVGVGSQELLWRMGAYYKVMAKKPWPIDTMIVSAPNNRVMEGRDLPGESRPIDPGFVIPRKTFDQVLFNHAAGFDSVETVEGFTAQGLVEDRGRVTGVYGRYKGRPLTLSGRVIVGADGAHSKIAKSLGLYNNNPKHRIFALRAYYQNVAHADHSIQIHYENSIIPGYGWIFHTGPQTANVGAGVILRYTPARELPRIFDAFLKNNPFAIKKLANAKMVKGSFAGWPIPCGSFSSKRSCGSVLLTGDAGSFVDNLTGEGIYYALGTGELAARAAAFVIKRGINPQNAGANYEWLWRRRYLWKDFIPAYILQGLWSKRPVINWVINRAAHNQRLAFTLCSSIAHLKPKARLLFPF